MSPTNAVERSPGSISSATVLLAWVRFRRSLFPDPDPHEAEHPTQQPAPHPVTTSTPATTSTPVTTTGGQVDDEPYWQVLYSARTRTSKEEERKSPSQSFV